MADLTNLDETLQRILSEPSTAARIALAAADVLGEHPHLTANTFARDYATTLAARDVTRDLPRVVADEAIRAAGRALPHPRPGETCGELAVRFRATAGEL